MEDVRPRLTNLSQAQITQMESGEHWRLSPPGKPRHQHKPDDAAVPQEFKSLNRNRIKKGRSVLNALPGQAIMQDGLFSLRGLPKDEMTEQSRQRIPEDGPFSLQSHIKDDFSRDLHDSMELGDPQVHKAAPGRQYFEGRARDAVSWSMHVIHRRRGAEPSTHDNDEKAKNSTSNIPRSWESTTSDRVSAYMPPARHSRTSLKPTGTRLFGLWNIIAKSKSGRARSNKRWLEYRTKLIRKFFKGRPKEPSEKSISRRIKLQDSCIPSQGSSENEEEVHELRRGFTYRWVHLQQKHDWPTIPEENVHLAEQQEEDVNVRVAKVWLKDEGGSLKFPRFVTENEPTQVGARHTDE